MGRLCSEDPSVLALGDLLPQGCGGLCSSQPALRPDGVQAAG